MPLVLNGATSGSTTIQATDAVTATLTLPSTTDTLVGKATTDTLTNKTLTSPTITGASITVAATAAPTFSAYPNSNQSISNLTWTKLSFQVEEWDTNSNFDSTTNYRFTPTVAGYYQLNSGVQWSGGTFAGENGLSFYKNGSSWKTTQDLNSAAYGISGSCLVYLNGSTDYVELYAIQGSGGAKSTYSSTSTTFFQAAMVRSA